MVTINSLHGLNLAQRTTVIKHLCECRIFKIYDHQSAVTSFLFQYAPEPDDTLDLVLRCVFYFRLVMINKFINCFE